MAQTVLRKEQFITALNESPIRVKYMIDEFKERRTLILDLISKIDGFKANTPEGAFYVFPDISAYFGKTIKGKLINNATDFSMLLLEEAHVATVTGDAFGEQIVSEFLMPHHKNKLKRLYIVLKRF